MHENTKRLFFKREKNPVWACRWDFFSVQSKMTVFFFLFFFFSLNFVIIFALSRSSLASGRVPSFSSFSSHPIVLATSPVRDRRIPVSGRPSSGHPWGICSAARSAFHLNVKLRVCGRDHLRSLLLHVQLFSLSDLHAWFVSLLLFWGRTSAFVPILWDGSKGQLAKPHFVRIKLN